jgi:hypothetical protein
MNYDYPNPATVFPGIMYNDDSYLSSNNYTTESFYRKDIHSNDYNIEQHHHNHHHQFTNPTDVHQYADLLTPHSQHLQQTSSFINHNNTCSSVSSTSSSPSNSNSSISDNEEINQNKLKQSTSSTATEFYHQFCPDTYLATNTTGTNELGLNSCLKTTTNMLNLFHHNTSPVHKTPSPHYNETTAEMLQQSQPPPGYTSVIVEAPQQQYHLAHSDQFVH